MSDSGRQDVGTMEGTENREDLSPLPEDVSTDEPATAEVPVNEIDIKHDTKAAQESIEASLREEIAKLQQCCQEKDALIEKLNQTIADQRSAQSDDQSKFEARIKQVQLDSIRKENISNMKLSLKIQEAQEYLAKIDALNQTRVPSSTQLQSYLLDPTLNYLFEKMRTEVDQAKSRVEEMQNEMAAWKFSADSNTGKQLMAKCRLLHQENQELGKMITSGTIAKLESGLAIHKNFSEDLKKSQAEFEEVLMEMEEDIDGFQNTVYYLQQQLKESHEKNAQLEKEIAEYKSQAAPSEQLAGELGQDSAMQVN